MGKFCWIVLDSLKSKLKLVTEIWKSNNTEPLAGSEVGVETEILEVDGFEVFVFDKNFVLALLTAAAVDILAAVWLGDELVGDVILLVELEAIFEGCEDILFFLLKLLLLKFLLFWCYF